MTCEPGFHGFKPFPRSRSLYCGFCGTTVERDVAAAVTPPSSAERTALAKLERLVAGGEPVDARQQTLPFAADADTGRARDIVAERRASREQREFESAVDRILEDAGVDEGTAAEMRREALDVGPDLDLDRLRAIAEEVAGRRADRGAPIMRDGDLAEIERVP